MLQILSRRSRRSAFVESITAQISLPAGCLFVGHTNTDLDSVGGAVGAAELYDGRACLAQPPVELNGEIMYAVTYARTGRLETWSAKDIEAWRVAALGEAGDPRALEPFGTAGRGTLAVFDDVFVASPQGDRPRVCIVDHNAPSQMVPALKSVLVDQGDTDVLAGIIDHHALDKGCYTKGPTFVDIRPWGSMCSIVTHSFIRSARPFPVDVARLMLCAILSDTVNLTSPTTTWADRFIVPLLARFCGEESVNMLAQQLFKAKTAWFVTLSPFEVVRADEKNFTSTAGLRWGWATVEVNEPDKLLAQTEQLLLELHHLKQEKRLQLVFLSVVNLAAKTSVVLLCGTAEVSLAKAAFPSGRIFSSALSHGDAGDRASLVQLSISLETSAIDVGALMSRKKEFKPAIDNALAAGWSLPSASGDQSPVLVVHTETDDRQKLKRAFSIGKSP